MATIDSKDFITKLITHNGWCDDEDHEAFDNPRVSLIVEYTNAFDNLTWGVTFTGENPNKYLIETIYVKNPKIIWDAKEHPL